MKFRHRMLFAAVTHKVYTRLCEQFLSSCNHFDIVADVLVVKSSSMQPEIYVELEEAFWRNRQTIANGLLAYYGMPFASRSFSSYTVVHLVLLILLVLLVLLVRLLV